MAIFDLSEKNLTKESMNIIQLDQDFCTHGNLHFAKQF